MKGLMNSTFQQFQLDRKQKSQTIKKCDLTFICFSADEAMRRQNVDTLQRSNQFLLQNLNKFLFGQAQSTSTFRVQKLHNVRLMIKQTQYKGRSVRVIYCPVQFYQLRNITKSYQSMVQYALFMNIYLYQNSTNAIKPIIISSVGQGSKVKGLIYYQFKSLVNSCIKLIKNQLNIQRSEIFSKLSFLLISERGEQSTIYCSQKQKQIEVIYGENQTFMMTQSGNFYNIDFNQTGQSLKQITEPILDTQNVIIMQNLHKIFHYKRFTSIIEEVKIQYLGRQIIDKLNKKSVLSKEQKDTFKVFQDVQGQVKLLPKQIADKICQPLMALLKPIALIKKAIYTRYQGFEFKLKEQNWASNNDDLIEFNQKFGFSTWLQSLVQDNVQINERTIINAGQIWKTEQLQKFTQQLKRYNSFSSQSQHLIHALILDHINQIPHTLRRLKQQVQKRNLDSISEYIEMSTYCKMIVRFIGSLKRYQLFKSCLQDYEAQFSEYILELLLSTYDEFCYINKSKYGRFMKLNDLIVSLQSPKPDILKIILKVQKLGITIANPTQPKISQLQSKKQVLVNYLRLLTQNKPTQKDKTVDIKIFKTIYELGLAYYKIYLQSVQSQSQQNIQKDLRYALRILWNDLYIFIFKDSQRYKEYVSQLEFNQRQLLQTISGILKVLNRLELSIEIQKKLQSDWNVEKYYNRLIMSYNRFDQKRNQILWKAIEYFKLKFDQVKVRYYYDQLQKNANSIKQKNSIRQKKYKYLVEMKEIDPRIMLEKIVKLQFQLNQQVMKKIVGVYSSNSEVNQN